MLLRRISAITILAFFLSSANALAESNSIPPQLQAQTIEQYTPPDPSPLIEEIGLTEEQITQLNQISRKFSPLLDSLYEKWDEAQQELETLIVSADASESQVRQKYSDVEALRTEISQLQFERRMAIRDVLRPDQRLPFEQYMQSLVDNS
ncbi:MAG: Spy/CpxP family protein refolding chaperone [Coleofasciculus sp. B1-GNL1-01]|uniref:Spy/CpxP family protein refolding chaperone n=1 Tax=Coleofasciculus sp. B1-GNL1-01 TaxID=3068484 RepID=UPI0032FEE782